VTTTTSTTSSSSTSSTSWSTDASNYDWSALIEATVEDKLATADSIETKVTENEAKITAYEELQSLLSDLADVAEVLSNPESSTAEDAFDARSATVTSSGSVSADSVVSLTLESGAGIGSYELEVEQLAQAHKVAGTVMSSQSTALGYDGEFTIGLTGGESTTITVDSDMTLSDIAEAINNATDTTNVQATIVQISDTEFELVLSAAVTGYDITFSSTAGDDILNELGVTDDAGAFTDVLQASQNAIIVLDGIEITRDSNDIDDVLEGVTISLYQETEDDTSLTIEIGTDTDTIESYIESFVTAYNALREYVLTQQETSSSGTASEDAALFGDGTLRSIVNGIYNALTTTIDGLSMSDLGLSFDESNYLELDTSVLSSLLSSDLDSVKALLTCQVATSSSQLGLVARGAEAPSSFTLDIDLDDDGSITSVSVDGDATLFEVSGTTIRGAEGTAYEGYTFVYTGSKDASVDVTVSYGMCASLFDVSDSASDTSSGTLQTLIEALTETNENLEEDVAEIESEAEDLREKLETQYSKIAADIAEAQSVLDYLDALLNSD
jgi:flagellar hook-associated protein 2